MYSVATGASEYESAKRYACLFLHVIGKEAVKVYNNFTMSARIIEKFDGYCNPKKNETFERHKFFIRMQNNDETIDHFVNDLRTLSQTCNFGPLADLLIRDRLICGILNEHLRKRMLRNEELTLDKAVTMRRIAENTASLLKSLKVVDSTIEINQNTTNQSDSKEIDYVKRKLSYSITKITRYCYFCKRDHPRRKCPAYGRQCHDCNGKNYYEGSKACQINRKDVNTINSADSTTGMSHFLLDTCRKQVMKIYRLLTWK